MILTTLKNLYWAFQSDPNHPKPGLWYARKAELQDDGSFKLDTKRSQYWSSRDSLIGEYHRRCKQLQRVTPYGAVEPPDVCLYKWWDDEEYDLKTEAEAKGGWRYFYIYRKET